MRKRYLLNIILICSVLGLSACGTQGEGDKSIDVSPAAIQESTLVERENDISNAKTLKEAFINDFSVGVAAGTRHFNDEEEMNFIKEHFNSITMENEMKPESLLDYQKTDQSKDKMPEINKERLKFILLSAKENGLKLRGHCLVWHSQTPDWFFSKDYEPSKGPASKKVMKKRMEVYIKKVLTYAEEIYPGGVYAWDVVNEVVGDDGDYRKDSGWYRTYGDESYIYDAFKFARKYAANDAKLFLNDYNEYIGYKRNLILTTLRKLHDMGVVDGMGMQSHWDKDFPDTYDIESSIKEYADIPGLEIQLTEIDMHMTSDTDAGYLGQAERYKEIFEILLRLDRTGVANITNVTFWGIDDEDTWLTANRGEESYPLLFHGSHEKKPCYDSILEAAKEKYE